MNYEGHNSNIKIKEFNENDFAEIVI